MKKRLLSLISILALAISNFTVVATAQEPAVAPTVGLKIEVVDCEVALSDENYDEDFNYEDYWDANVYAVKMTLTGAAKKSAVKDENGTRYAFTGTFVDTIQSTFKYTLPAGKELVNIKQDLIASGTKGSKFEDGVLTFSWTDSTPLKAETLVATLYFVMSDKSEIDIEKDITIKADANGTNFMQVSEYYDGTTETKYTNIKVTDLDIVEYPEVVTPAGPNPGDIKTPATAISGNKKYSEVYDSNLNARVVFEENIGAQTVTADSVLKAKYLNDTHVANIFELLGITGDGEVEFTSFTVKMVLPAGTAVTDDFSFVIQ